MIKEIYSPKNDGAFKKPFVDKTELKKRKLISGEEVEYTYMHGGFRDTNVKFSFCFPKKEFYEGRFFQYLSPFPGPNEEIASLVHTGINDKIAFAITHGAYYVESNMGAKSQFTPGEDSSIFYRASAATAEYSRIVANQFYGKHRVYGYVYGGSGGGYKTMACIENTNAFDGAVPYIIGSPVAIPMCHAVRAHGLRVLRHKLKQIVDAIEAGGSNNPYESLNEEEAKCLEEVTAMGFPVKSWFAYEIMGDGALPVLAPGVKEKDPTYFEDFWCKEGYLGFDENSSAVKDRILHKSTVSYVHVAGQKIKSNEIDGRNGADNAWQKILSDGGEQEKPWIAIESFPEFGENPYLTGLKLVVESGELCGVELSVEAVQNGKVIIGSTFGVENLEKAISSINIGDEVRLDNSDYIAIQTYYRHQDPGQQYTCWDQFRDENKRPIYPQRKEEQVGSVINGGCDCYQDGQIQGKVIVVAALMDESAFPWQADWYYKRVESVQKGKAKEKFRLWYADHGYHDDRAQTIDELHVTAYLGVLRQALLDVSQWVEKGIEPAENTNYTINNGQVVLTDNLEKMGGIQPLISAESYKFVAEINKPVCIKASIQVPHNTGEITSAKWSLNGDTEFSTLGEIEFSHNKAKAVVKLCHTFQKTGQTFVVLRVTSNRKGQLDPFTQCTNICRFRVVVE